MAKHNKGNGNGKRQIKRETIDDISNDDVAQESAEVLICATKTAHEFSVLCDHYTDDLECDIPYLRVALEIWAEHPELAQSLRSTLEELLQALNTHCQTLKGLRQRLEILATEHATDVHLDALERYRRLIRERLFPEAPAT
jgi:hypothetical protein